jgi:tetratricopeptide (TPR) repeat protein
MSKKRIPKEFKSRSKATQKPPVPKKETLSLRQEAGLLSDLFNQGRFEEAEENARRLLKEYPEWVYGWNLLGACCGQLEKYNEALGAFQKVLSFLPNDPHVYNNIGPVFQELGRLREAVESLRKAVALSPDSAMAHLNLGIALRKQGKSKEAEGSLRKALALKPDYPEAYSNIALIYEDLGKMEEARLLFEKAIALAPWDPQILGNYPYCRKFTGEDQHWIDRFERTLSQTQREKDRTHLHYAIGKMYDDAGHYDEAFEHYRQANWFQRTKSGYQPKQFSTDVDNLIKIFSPGQPGDREWTGSPSDLPVFILGMPRSGTSLVEQIISSHPLVFGAGELEFFVDNGKNLVKKYGLSYPECLGRLTTREMEEMADNYLGLLRELGERAVRVTDKMPSNFIHLGLISFLFPKARVIHCRRNPLDTCLSIFFQNFDKRHPYANDLNDLGQYYGEYERLMAHWKQIFPSEMMLEVDYEEILEKPEEMSRRLIDFCGLDWDDRCLKFHENKRTVRTASSWQVRQPLYKTSRERWRNYEKLLGPLVKEISKNKAGENDDSAVLIRSALKRYSTGSNDEAFVQEILKTEKDIFDALQMLGIKAGQEGRYEEAEALIRQAIRINASSGEAFHNLGIVLMKRGKLDEAAETFQQACEIPPGIAMAHYDLGNIFQQQGKFPEAIESYQKAIDLNPKLVEAYFNLGAALQELGMRKEAIKSYRKALGLKPDYAEAYCNLGNALREEGRLPEAIESCQTALALDPDSSPSHNNLGNALQELGKLSEAAKSYWKAIELNPENTLAYRNYVTCRKFTAEDLGLADCLEALLEKMVQEEDRSNLHYALGKIYDDCRIYEASFRNHRSCNQLERKKYSYNWKDFTSYADRVIKAFPPGFHRDRNWSGASSDLPVFVLGMPRSGTTLIEQIISSHPQVFGAGELRYLEEMVRSLKFQHGTTYPECLSSIGSNDFIKMANGYLEYLGGFSDKSLRVTDKMPGNFLHLGLISLLFEKTRIIHCRRNPMDTCLSIFFQRFSGKSHPYSCTLEELGNYYLDYERLMAHWREVLPQGMMFEVQYEEVLERPEEMSRRLIDFCGLEWDDRCLRFYENDRKVRTASAWQVRQPLYKTSRERWRNYEKFLDPLRQVLEGRIE